ncbi:hypothetical protein K9L05_00810 [Candidatus Babeliales bacterium]|nr:hypothetical protein [Candidatus Babeliales bacterium]
MNKFINFKKLIFSFFLLSLFFSPVFLMEDGELQNSDKHDLLENTGLEQMPDDIILEIISKINNPKDLCNISALNRRFKQLVPNKYGHLAVHNQIQKTLQKFPNIRSLTIFCCTQITDSDLLAISNCHLLQSLYFWECKQIDILGLRFLTKCPKLQHLNFNSCEIKYITLYFMALYISNFPNLKSLRFTQCNITDTTIQELKKALPNLGITRNNPNDIILTT